MELETVIDPSIEGGFIFDINDYRLDASAVSYTHLLRCCVIIRVAGYAGIGI